MRLIDADKLIEKWDELSVRGRTEFDQVIMSMPTAYDIDYTLRQCKDKAIELMNKQYIEDEYHMFSKGVQAMYLGVEKIIKEGGLDE